MVDSFNNDPLMIDSSSAILIVFFVRKAFLYCFFCFLLNPSHTLRWKVNPFSLANMSLHFWQIIVEFIVVFLIHLFKSFHLLFLGLNQDF